MNEATAAVISWCHLMMEPFTDILEEMDAADRPVALRELIENSLDLVGRSCGPCDVDLSAVITDRAMLDHVDWTSAIGACFERMPVPECGNPGADSDRFVQDENGWLVYGDEYGTAQITVDHAMEVQRAVWERRQRNAARV